MSDTDPFWPLKQSGTSLSRRDRVLLGNGPGLVINLGTYTDQNTTEQHIPYGDISGGTIAQIELEIVPVGGVSYPPTSPPGGNPLIVACETSTDYGATWTTAVVAQLGSGQYRSVTPCTSGGGLSRCTLLRPNVLQTGAAHSCELTVLSFIEE